MRPSVDDFMAEWAAASKNSNSEEHDNDDEDATTHNPTTTTTTTTASTTTASTTTTTTTTTTTLQHQPISVGNAEIWNPHVILEIHPFNNNNLLRGCTTSTASTTTSTIPALPTNPQVELIRRRAHEGFLQTCFQILQQSNQTNNWKVAKLPIPSLLEKWHMDAKLHETKAKNNVVHAKNKNRNVEQQSQQQAMPLIASTTEIYTLYCQQQQQQGQQGHQQNRLSLFPDPVLLQSPAAVSFFKPLLQAELENALPALPPKFPRQIQGIHKALQRAMIQAQDSFQKQLQQAYQQEVRLLQQQSHRGKGKSKGKATFVSKQRLPKLDLSPDLCRVTYAGVTLQLHAAYYDKLHQLFLRQQQQQQQQQSQHQQDQQQSQLSWNEVLFCILCRYDMIQGAGLQAGVPGRVMDVLMETLDCRMECFASPFNCRYGQYASAFGLDRCLGSLGSFFDLELEEGCYEANPPFCEAFILRFNQRMAQLLQTAQDKNKDLMFVVIVPTWKKSAAYQSLLDNTFLKHHLQLPQGKHWYTEGTQHRRKASFRVASFDTSILFYQTVATATATGQSKWEISTEMLQQLEEAFCQDPGEMVKSKASVVGDANTDATTTATPSEPKGSKKRAAISLKDPPSVTSITTTPSQQQQQTQQGQHPTTTRKQKRKQDAAKPKNNKSSKKKKLASNNPKEESQAQMDLLASLGLS